MGGIETARRGRIYLNGCSTVQVTTSVMQYGYRIIDDLIDGLKRYMSEKGFNTIYDFLGKANEKIILPTTSTEAIFASRSLTGKSVSVAVRLSFVAMTRPSAIRMNADSKPF